MYVKDDNTPCVTVLAQQLNELCFKCFLTLSVMGSTKLRYFRFVFKLCHQSSHSSSSGKTSKYFYRVGCMWVGRESVLTTKLRDGIKLIWAGCSFHLLVCVVLCLRLTPKCLHFAVNHLCPAFCWKGIPICKCIFSHLNISNNLWSHFYDLL